MEIELPPSPQLTPPTTAADFPPSYFPVLAEGSYTWHLSQVSALLSPEARDERITSPMFTAGGHSWFLNLIPRSSQLSLYLALGEFAPETRGGVCADLIFLATSPDGQHVHVRMTSHRFASSTFLSSSPTEIPDWGFQGFLSIRALTEAVEAGPFVQDDALSLTVKLRIVKDDPSFVRSMHMQTLSDSCKFAKSRQTVGFVGLHNQGATCYMNSILQSLFLTNAFRRATLQIPTHGAKPGGSIPLALQRIFYQLQFSDDPPNTNELTDSFGWDTYQAFTQHDVQEFLRALLDDLEGKMKKTPAEGSIERLFVSKVCQIVQCLNVEFESVRMDTLYDVQLPILGCKNLKESLDKYVAPEYLEGSNKYNAEGHGLQDAKMYSAFETLPPVLHLILMRYRYDVDLDETVKINDRFEFPPEIDMSPYLRDKSPQKDQDATYVLHSVLVHSGDLHGGHYCAFIRDPRGEDWYKFDDTKVTKVDSHEAIEDNYGEDPHTPDSSEPADVNDGEESAGKISRTMSARRTRRMVKKITNAYMLVYIRKREVEEGMAPVHAHDYDPSIALRLREEAEQERHREEQEKLERLTTVVSYVTQEDAMAHKSYDLIANAESGSGFPSMRQLRIRRNDSRVWELKQELGQQLSASPMDIWMCTNRRNRTVRPHALVGPDEAYLHHFLEESSYFLVLPANELNGDSLITFKLLDSAGLRVLRMKACSGVEVIGDLILGMSELIEIPHNDIIAFEEMSPRKIVPLDPTMTLEQAKLRCGDIIVITSSQHNVLEHYQELYDQVQVIMIDVDSLEDNEQETDSFVMTLSRRDAVKSIYEKLGEHVECPMENLRLWYASAMNEEPLNQALDPNSAALFFEKNIGTSYSTRTIYYSVQDGSEKPKLRIVVLDANFEVKGEAGVKPEALKVVDLYDRFGSALDGEFDPSTCPLLQVTNKSITAVHRADVALASLDPSSVYYYCGVRKSLNADCCLLFFVRKGIPGYTWVKPRETVAEMLKGLSAGGAALYDGEEMIVAGLDGAADIYEVLTGKEKRSLHVDLLSSKNYSTSSSIKFHK